MRRFADLELKVSAGFKGLEAQLSVVPQSLAKLAAESEEHRRNINRLWRWGGGLGAAITGTAAALAKWLS